MSTCTSCGAGLEWSSNGRGHARCTRCAALFSSDGTSLTPVRLEAPGGGFNAEFQSIFEEQLGFPRRIVPNAPPSYWGGAGGGGASATSAPSTNAIQRIIQLSIAGFVLLLLGGIGLYVAWILWTTLPH